MRRDSDCRPMEPDIRQNVRVAQMRMLFDTPLPGMLMASVFALALAWHMRGAVAGAVLVAWIVLKAVGVLPRVAHAHLFGRRRDDSLGWLHWGAALLLVDGLTWGLAGVLLMVPQDVSAI